MEQGFTQADVMAKREEQIVIQDKRTYTKGEVEAFLAEISRRIVESPNSYMHALLALNHLLRLPNAREILDEDLKEQMRDIWKKLRSTGLQLNDPPILFGVGELNTEADNPVVEDEGEETDGSVRS